MRGRVLFLAAAVMLVGCGSGGRAGAEPSTGAPATAPATTPAAATTAAPATSGPALAGAHCPAYAAGGTQVRFADAGGATLAGIVLGTGARGVVLAHQTRADVCQWLPFARELATAGYRVLAFDFAGYGASDPGGPASTVAADVTAATAYLRGQGVRSVVLVGASMGGTAVVAAAATIAPTVSGVVSLSGPAFFGGVDAKAAAAKLTAPVLYAAGTRDTDFADSAQAMYDATPPATKRTLLLVPSAEHGVDFVSGNSEPGRQVRQAVLDFLTRYDR
jgi:pimeloyl-ACP methyl ester carboxylesterase